MVAGYAIGGGHVLHLVCDLTIAADNARFGQVGPEGRARSTAASARACSRTSSGPKKAKEIWFLCRQYDAAGGPRDGARQHGRAARAPRGGDGRWCREMLALSPFALRLLKASFNAAEDGLSGHPAARPRREPAVLRQRGGAGGPRRLPGEAQAGLLALPASAPSRVSAVRIWVMAARLRTLPAAVAPVLVGTSLALGAGHFHPLGVRRGAARRDLHPGRDEPLQRLLRRAPRRRHRGPPRARCG